MQDEPDKTDADAAEDEVPLSSETPDTVVDAQGAAPASQPEPEPAGDELEKIQPDEPPQADANETAAASEPAAADTAGEQPDGQVTPDADDLLADANAVDPKISVSLLEAYLFSTHSPLTPGRLAELFNLESTKPIRKAIRVLNEQYEQTGRCFRVEQVAGGFQLLTLPEHGDHLKALHQKEQDAKLTKAALETLAIIAYKQPILRADIEAIRGVASGETIRSLMEKHLVKIAGRAEEPGRPILYGTTKRFLEVFGLNNLKDLPQPDLPQARSQLSPAARALLGEEPAPTPEATVPTVPEPTPQESQATTPPAEAAPPQETPAETPATPAPSAETATPQTADTPVPEAPETPQGDPTPPDAISEHE